MANEGSTPGDIFDVKKVRRLAELMKEHDLAEIDLRQGEQRVRIRRGGEPLIMTPPPGYHVPAAAHSQTHASATSSSSAPPSAADDRDMQVIKSPMVGTFYTAANPESPPFVKVGDHVGPDTVVCIIEAMKVFNEIPAEVSGQIAAVLVENNTPVEFGQPLFKVTRQ
jgi:acetyl-CoA carboxylase biotin carboxyl carrier protein